MQSLSINTFGACTAVHQPFLKLSIPQDNPSIPLSQIKTRPWRSPNAVFGSVLTVPLPSYEKFITSPSNPFVKHCVKLRTTSSYRHAHGSVLVVGSTPIRETCIFQRSKGVGTTKIDCLFILDNAEIPEGLDDHNMSLIRVSTLVMKKLSGLQSVESTDAIALMRIPSTFHTLNDDHEEANFRSLFPSLHRILVLDRIQDPGNLGTLLRSAIGFRWCGVFLLRGCCDAFNEKAVRSSRGASFQLPIVSGSWIHLEALAHEFDMKILAGHPATRKDAAESFSWLSPGLADSLADTPLCLILGSEGGGLSVRTRKAAKLVSIPMVGQFESLNVSVAGGILLYMLQPENLRFA